MIKALLFACFVLFFLFRLICFFLVNFAIDRDRRRYNLSPPF